jgi:hypothetical protein
MYFALAVTALAVTQSARAADEQYTVAGAGAVSCGKWIETRAFQNSDLDNLLVAWVQGFLSGLNAQRFALTKQEMAVIPDPPTLLAYVDKFCRENPLQTGYAAAISLYREIQKP